MNSSGKKFRTLAERMGARRSEQIGAIVSHIEDCKEETLAELSHLLTSRNRRRAGQVENSVELSTSSRTCPPGWFQPAHLHYD